MGVLGSMGIAGETHDVPVMDKVLKPLVLAIETSSRMGSVALARGADLLGQTTFSAALRHSAEILPAIAGLLHRSGYGPSDLTQVHICIGPGSFTGLRIAVVAAKAMHLAHGVRIVAVNALDTIAANVTDAPSEGAFQRILRESPSPWRLAVVLDAKRGQFYTAIYEHADAAHGPGEGADYGIPGLSGGLWRKTVPDCLMTSIELCERFANPAAPILMAGDGLLHHQGQFEVEGTRVLDPAFWSPHATGLLRLGRQKATEQRFSDPLTLVPFYLRGPEVTLRKQA